MALQTAVAVSEKNDRETLHQTTNALTKLGHPEPEGQPEIVEPPTPMCISPNSGTPDRPDGQQDATTQGSCISREQTAVAVSPIRNRKSLTGRKIKLLRVIARTKKLKSIT